MTFFNFLQVADHWISKNIIYEFPDIKLFNFYDEGWKEPNLLDLRHQ